ncbi:MAG TPA: T9SS type A sorting domain-containing protein [Edaphocola sp.]|nr:T9SS type A sorting domain-containing protein [Edaphocola sp.]
MKWIGLFWLLFANINSQAQTIYTVNSALPTGGTNFTNFTDLTTELNTNGITGPVVVNVVPGSGPYIDTIHFMHISGASPTNTIRINGNGETVTNVYWNNPNYYYFGHSVLTFDSTKYVTVDNLVIKLNDSAGYYGAYGNNGVQMVRGSAYDSVIHCVIDMTRDSATYYYSYGNRSGILISGTSGYYYYYYDSVPGASQCYIGYNTIIDSTSWNNYYYSYNGLFGIGVMKGSDHNIIDHNTIQARQFYGIYLYGAEATKVTYNDIGNPTNNDTGAYVYNPVGIYTQDTINGTEIIGNRIHDPNLSSQYYYGNNYRGMQLTGHGTITEPILVANNAIYNLNYNGGIYGIYVSGRYSKIYNNTIAINDIVNSAANDYGIYLTSNGNNEGIEIKNNNVSITGGGTGSKYGFYYQDYVTDAQKNNFYVQSSQTGPNYYGFYFTDYNNQASFQYSNPNLELGSPTVNPQFVNVTNGNLSVQNLGIIAQGENLTSVVPLDILQNPRPPIPTLGAFEAVLATNNAAINTFITPTDSFCASSQPISVLIYNAGVNDIDSLQLHWTVNGITQPVVTYANTLTSIASTAGQHKDTVLLGNILIPSGSPTTIKVWTTMPNGMADTVNSNDTILKTFQAIPSNYSVMADLDTICPSLSAHLTLIPDTGSALDQLTWQYSINGTSWVDLPNSDSTSYTDDNMTTSKLYRAKLNLLQTCYSDTQRVTVIDPQVLNTTPSGGCDSSAVTLTATSNSNTILNWYAAPSATTPLGTGSTFITPPLTATKTYYVAATINGISGCESSRQPVTATIEHPLPDIPLHDTSFCTGETISIEAGNTGSAYLWNTGDTTRNIEVADSGIYNVVITSHYHCTSMDSIQVILRPLANVNGFNFIPLFPPNLGTVKFYPIDPAAVNHYEWQLGDGALDTTENPIHAYTSTGDYLVSLTVSNYCGNKTVSQLIHVDLTTGIVTLKSDQTADVIIYPNPGRDILTIQSKNPELRMNRISMYNMLGKKVYETSVKSVVKQQVSVSDLSSGTYLLRILTNKNITIIRKFQVVR